MIRIENFINYLKELNENNNQNDVSEIKNLSVIKNEMDNLENIDETINNFENNNILHNKQFLKGLNNIEIPLKIKLLNSKLKEKQEINERLESLCNNLGILRTTIFTQDFDKAKKIINKFLKNDYSSVNVIVNELNDFKSKIDKVDFDYNLLLNTVSKSLDLKLNGEFDYKNHINNLNEIHRKQKQLLVGISLLFINLSKNIMKKVKQ